MTRCACIDGQWQDVVGEPLQPISLHPGTHALHYASQGFEGMKAYRQEDGSVKLFRHDDHVRRFRRTAAGLHLPVPPASTVDAMIRATVRGNFNIVPDAPATLYLRPTIIGTEANIGAVTRSSRSALMFVIVSPLANYFSNGSGPLRIMIADCERAVSGIGAIKAGAKYASALGPIEAARHDVGADQVLFCPNGDVQETGTSNFILVNGEELITKPLSSAFLPGIMRDSILRLAAEMGYLVREIDFDVSTLLTFIQSGEAALTGTAAVVTPVRELIFDRQSCAVKGSGEHVDRLRNALTDIQFGRTKDRYSWMFNCDDSSQ